MPLQLVIFDFDLTISTIHLFHVLAGTAPVPLQSPPFARSERGQLARLLELEASPQHQSQGGFSVAVLGGRERVAQVQALLTELRAAGAECIICTRGFIGPVRKCLELAGLLPLFTQVYGNIGDINGTTDLDVSLSQTSLGADEQHLGSNEFSMEEAGHSKQKVVSRCLQDRGLGPNDAVFVDDTWAEISNMHGTCLTIQVQPPQGLGQREMAILRGLLAGGAAADAALAAAMTSAEASLAANAAGSHTPAFASSTPPASVPAVPVALTVRTPPGSLTVKMPAARNGQVDPFALLESSVRGAGPQRSSPPRQQRGKQGPQLPFAPMPASSTVSACAPGRTSASTQASTTAPNGRQSVSPVRYAQGCAMPPRLPDFADGPPSILPPEILRVGEEQRQQREEAAHRQREAQHKQEDAAFYGRSEGAREAGREPAKKVWEAGAHLQSLKICGPDRSFIIMDSRDHVSSSCSMLSSEDDDARDRHWFRVDDDWHDWLAPNVIKQRGFGPGPGTPITRQQGKPLDGNKPGCCNQ